MKIAINLIITLIAGYTICTVYLYFQDAWNSVLKLKRNIKIYAIGKNTLSITLIRGIILLMILIFILGFERYRFRMDILIFTVAIILIQSVGDIINGVICDKILEDGLITKWGFKKFYFVRKFSWTEINSIGDGKVTLKIEISSHNQPLEFLIDESQKNDINEFLKLKLHWLIKNKLN